MYSANNPIENILNQAKINCRDLHHHTQNQLLMLSNKYNSCEFFFDNLMCWPRTPAGTIAKQNCSNSYIKSTKNGMASRFCTENGKWFVNNSTNETWTDYTECGKFYIESIKTIYPKWLEIIKNLRTFGFSISIICLLISIIIFIRIKRLHCSRNKLHIHLFISFVVRGIMSLIKDSFDTEISATWFCKTITSVRFYFITSNYMFLLMEGFYLHNLMFLNIFSENGVAFYYVAGWTLPLLTLIPWIVLKLVKENNYCWSMKENPYIFLLIEGPIGLSIIINFIIFTIIIRILFIKLTSMYLQQRKLKYRKLLRSTLILVPLFGIPYMISLILQFYVKNNITLEIVWLFFDQTFISFHGLFASLVYCISNSEVQIEIKRKYHSFKDRKNSKEFRRNRTISHTTQMPLNEELQEFHFNTGEKLIGKKVTSYF